MISLVYGVFVVIVALRFILNVSVDEENLIFIPKLFCWLNGAGEADFEMLDRKEVHRPREKKKL